MKNWKKMCMILLMMMLEMSPAQAGIKVSSDSTKQTTYEKLISDYGQFIKVRDYKLPTIKLTTKDANFKTKFRMNIREVTKDGKNFFFLYLTGGGAYETLVTSVDLLVLKSALLNLIKQFENDTLGQCEFVSNYYTTSDFFEVGYYIKPNVLDSEIIEKKWYITFDKRIGEKYSFDFPDSFVTLFSTAIERIEEIKAKADTPLGYEE